MVLSDTIGEDSASPGPKGIDLVLSDPRKESYASPDPRAWALPHPALGEGVPPRLTLGCQIQTSGGSAGPRGGPHCSQPPLM